MSKSIAAIRTVSLEFSKESSAAGPNQFTHQSGIYHEQERKMPLIFLSGNGISAVLKGLWRNRGLCGGAVTDTAFLSPSGVVKRSFTTLSNSFCKCFSGNRWSIFSAHVPYQMIVHPLMWCFSFWRTEPRPLQVWQATFLSDRGLRFMKPHLRRCLPQTYY